MQLLKLLQSFHSTKLLPWTHMDAAALLLALAASLPSARTTPTLSKNHHARTLRKPKSNPNNVVQGPQGITAECESVRTSVRRELVWAARGPDKENHCQLSLFIFFRSGVLQNWSRLRRSNPVGKPRVPRLHCQRGPWADLTIGPLVALAACLVPAGNGRLRAVPKARTDRRRDGPAACGELQTTIKLRPVDRVSAGQCACSVARTYARTKPWARAARQVTAARS